MAEQSPRAAGPLAGVTVLELGSMYAAPTCGRMLRDFGFVSIKNKFPALEPRPSIAGTHHPDGVFGFRHGGLL